MPPRIDVRGVRRVLEKVKFEKKKPVYDDGRVIVGEGHVTLKAESRCRTRRNLVPTDWRR